MHQAIRADMRGVLPHIAARGMLRRCCNASIFCLLVSALIEVDTVNCRMLRARRTPHAVQHFFLR
ncbi:hypothetical protein C0Z18_29090 [Trinickia dabaoshanensis]|uniref:Uncharacterized protein n=1 Tax=Trinickia dabaoshanensis TaxID=564714 RepID=A0A2N7VCR9_9BURK|nr:hypothetical protein C0Z18_29090 [Trinickia dabaoshanensis]